MKIALIGYGGAGCRIADQFRRFERKTRKQVCVTSIGVDTAASQIQNRRRLKHSFVIGKDIFERRGSGGNLSKAMNATKRGANTITRPLNNLSRFDFDAILIINSLGGGTGGSACFLAERLQQYDKPIYTTSVLPHPNEADPYQYNAQRALSIAKHVENTILFDNFKLNVKEHTTTDNDDQEINYTKKFNTVNQQIARTLHFLFTADQRSTSDRNQGTTVETEDIMRALETGGLSSISYTSEPLPRYARPGITGKIFEFLKLATDPFEPIPDDQSTKSRKPQDVDIPHPTNLIPENLNHDNMFMACNPIQSERILHLLISPERYLLPEHVTDTGEWTKRNTESGYAVGNYPLKRGKVASLTLFSGIPVPERIEQLNNRAEQHHEHIQQQQLRDPREHNPIDDLDSTVPSPL